MNKLKFILFYLLLIIATSDKLIAQQIESDINLLSFYLNTDLSKADSLFNELEPQYLSNDIDSLYAKYYFFGGILNYYKENYILSELYYKKAFYTAYCANNLAFKTRIYNNLGITYELSQYLDSAYLAYSNSLTIEKKLNNTYGEMTTLLNIGLLRIKMKQYKLADSLLYHCLTYFIKQKDSAKIGLCYLNIGSLYENTGNLTKSNVAADQALFYFKTTNDTYSIGKVYYNLFSNYTLAKNSTLARKMLDSCRKYIDPNGSIALVRLPLDEALLISNEGNELEAIQLIETLSNKVYHDLEAMKLIAATKMDIFSKTGNQERHRAAFKEYSIYSDSLDLINNKKQITQLEIINKTKEISKKLEVQKLLVQKANLEKGYIIITSITLLVIFLLIVIFKRRFTKMRSFLVNNARSRQLETLEQTGQFIENELYIRAVDFLKKSELYLQTELKLETLAQELGTNISTLSKSINEASGDNFNQLINRLRVRHAEVLLLKNEHSIGEIAERVGFANRTSFYRSFKLKTGLSPKEYKDALINK